MAISHFWKHVRIHKTNGEMIEICCDSEEEAGQLAYDLTDAFADMVMRLNEEEKNEPSKNDRRFPHKVRVDVYGRPQELGK